jgi:hypothetical protein
MPCRLPVSSVEMPFGKHRPLDTKPGPASFNIPLTCQDIFIIQAVMVFLGPGAKKCLKGVRFCFMIQSTSDMRDGFRKQRKRQGMSTGIALLGLRSRFVTHLFSEP